MDLLPQVLKHYGMAVKYGHRHIFQTLPRLLTLYLDFGTFVKEQEQDKPKVQFWSHPVVRPGPGACRSATVPCRRCRRPY